MLDQRALARTLFPVGHFDKAAVRAMAADLGLRTAAKPDSQDVCFITSAGGRRDFLGRRMPFHPADVIDTAGRRLGRVDAIELVTVGQRKGLGLPGGGPKRFVLDVDRAEGTVLVGAESDLLGDTITVGGVTWVDGAAEGDVLVQCSAHGDPAPATVTPTPDGIAVAWHEPRRRVAPGQSVVVYDGGDSYVLGGGYAV
jgi:tRNA-specific 2-thiouridylase